jgi:hypothetical protein
LNKITDDANGVLKSFANQKQLTNLFLLHFVVVCVAINPAGIIKVVLAAIICHKKYNVCQVSFADGCEYNRLSQFAAHEQL